MSTSEEIKDQPEATGKDISTQENVSVRNAQKAKTFTSSSSSSSSQVRHRASVACASCRDRRIRCVVPQNQTECIQCQRKGTECVIKNDDERRRPISKAYMSSLSDRISMLEGMLKEKGVNPPPPAHPPKTRHDSKIEEEGSEDFGRHPQQLGGSPPNEVPSPPDSRSEDILFGDEDTDAMISSQTWDHALSKEDSPFRMLDQKQEDIVHRLLATKGNLSFDQLSGRIRFFGPTANSHVYAEPPDQFDSGEPQEQVRRAERIIRSLTIDTHDYLMNHFWEYYNDVIQVIDKEAFEADMDSQNPKYYSSFLHVTILAMGYRGADMARDDMRKISLGNRESILHREAKYMLDIELERPGGIPSVQALLLLGDLECGVGRDNTGWMYSGMANRLAFDVGLHLDCRNNDMPEQEVQIRQMTMRACIIYDRYWALFLGRPTSIKNQDIGMELLIDKLSLTSPSPPGGDYRHQDVANHGIVKEVHAQLVELMELASRIVETRENNVVKKNIDSTNMFAMNEVEHNAYLHVISLDRQLQNWYRRLPEHLTWKPANIKTAPYSYFLLHQQYHVTMILLHRPWAKYGSITSAIGDASNSPGSHPSPDSTSSRVYQDTTIQQHHAQGLSDDNTANHYLGMGDPVSMVHDSRTSLSRSICTQQAIRVARIFWQHRQRFDGRRIFVTGIQHAGTASIALIAALSYARGEADRRTYLGYLEILSAALSDMSQTYQPAARMDDLLKAVLSQVKPTLMMDDIVDVTNIPNLASMSGSGNKSSVRSTFVAPSVMLDPSIRVGGVNPSSARRGSGTGDEDLATNLPPQKKRRPSNKRRTSELTRPPPPFFNAHAAFGSSSQVRVPPFVTDHSSSVRHSLHMGSMNFSSMGGVNDGESSSLTFLESLGMDMDSSVDVVGGEHNSHHGVGNMLMTPSSESMSGFDALKSNIPMLDTDMGEWTSAGPAGLSASSVLGQSAAITNGLMSSIPTLVTNKNDGPHVISPGNLLQNGGDGSGKNGNGDNGEEMKGGRNHDLDFFSFS